MHPRRQTPQGADNVTGAFRQPKPALAIQWSYDALVSLGLMINTTEQLESVIKLAT